MPPPKLVAAAHPNVRVSNCNCADESLAVFFSFGREGKEQRCIHSERKSCNHSLGPSDLIVKMCGGICYLYREPPNMFKCEVRSPSFLLSKGFLDTICRAQPCAGCTCLWERLVWKQITSWIFTSMYWGAFMNHPGLWFLSQHHWSVPRHVTLWQKMLVTLPITFPLAVLTTSEVYSRSLEADMSENHRACSSVKWEVLPFFCRRVS